MPSKMSAFRLTYPVSVPFSKRMSAALITFWLSGFAGLIAWNFWSSAKRERCVPYTSGAYEGPDTCDSANITFSSTYYTRPRGYDSSTNETIGTFPWSPLGFGDGSSDGPINYSILSLPWRGEAMQCAMYSQNLLLELSTETSVISTCYYCGASLRTICTTVDSVRSQVPDKTISSYTAIFDNFGTLSAYAHNLGDAVVSGATVGSVRIKTHRTIEGVPEGVLPFDTSEFTVSLGTSLGPVVIRSSSANANISRVANLGQTLATLVEQATEEDLQSSSNDAANVSAGRTLQVEYLCRRCTDEYKPTLEIIALLMAGVSGVLSTLFTLAKLVAEAFSTPSQTSQGTPAHIYDPLSQSYFSKPASNHSNPASPALPGMTQVHTQPHLAYNPNPPYPSYPVQQPFYSNP